MSIVTVEIQLDTDTGDLSVGMDPDSGQESSSQGMPSPGGSPDAEGPGDSDTGMKSVSSLKEAFMVAAQLLQDAASGASQGGSSSQGDSGDAAFQGGFNAVRGQPS